MYKILLSNTNKMHVCFHMTRFVLPLNCLNVYRNELEKSSAGQHDIHGVLTRPVGWLGSRL